MTLAQDLRDACDKVRLKSYPLSDLIPLMQKAADALDSHESNLARWVRSDDETRQAIAQRAIDNAPTGDEIHDHFGIFTGGPNPYYVCMHCGYVEVGLREYLVEHMRNCKHVPDTTIR